MTPWRGAAVLAGLLAALIVGAAILPTVLREDVEAYEWYASWGGTGSAPGSFRGPIGIAVDGSGFVYVSDSGNDRIQKFTADGGFVAAWDGRDGDERRDGDDAGPERVRRSARPGIRRPMHLGLAGDSLLFVPEYLDDRVRLFRVDGTPVAALHEDTVAPGGALDAPGGALPSPSGDVWIADFFNHRIAVYGLAGIEEELEGGLPRGREGFRRQVGSAGRLLPGRLHYPTDVAFGPDGTAYVADAYNHRIQRFAADGRRLDAWGGPIGTGVPGPWKGWFRVATGVHVDDTGRVYVADFYNHRIQVFGPSGRFRGEWGEAGSGGGAFDRPTDVATGPDGSVYVVDFGNDRVQVFTCPGCGDD